MRFLVRQYNILAKASLLRSQVEIHEEDAIYGFYLILPFRSALALTHYRLGQVIQGAFLEAVLVFVLHLHYDFFTGLGGAVDIVYQSAVAIVNGHLFLVQKCDVLYLFFSFQQVVQEVNQQAFCYRLSENFLKTYVCKRINEFAHCFVRFVLVITKVRFYLRRRSVIAENNGFCHFIRF